MKDLKIGPKVWVEDLHNEILFSEVCRVLKNGTADFVEIMTPSGTFEKSIDVVKCIPGEIVIHAPHEGIGVEWSDPALMFSNLRAINDSFRFAYACNSKIIIVHTGRCHLVEETVRQISILESGKVVLENICANGNEGDGSTYLGTTDVELLNVLEQTGVEGICLDIAHVLSAAKRMGMDWVKLTERFKALNPKIYHMTDGNLGCCRDPHLPLGTGTYPIAEMVRLIPSGSLLTLETKQPHIFTLDHFEREVEMIKSFRECVYV